MIKKLLSILFIASFISVFGQVEAYYNDVDLTKSGQALKTALAVKITATHTNMLTYTPGVWEASKTTDINPNNTGQVILIYGWENGSDGDDTNDKFRDITLQDTGSGDPFRWNREHVYSKSLANPRFETDQPGPGTDAHNLRPADRTRNSTRNNFKFGEGTGNSGFSSVTYNGPSGPNTNAWYPGDEWKGDVARMMMYMYLRYGVQCLPTGVGVGSTTNTGDDMIDLFLKWNVEDPVSDLEKVRNTYHSSATNQFAQGNRNPFIDNPYLATRIWGGDSAQDLWGIYTSSDTEAPTVPTNVTLSAITTSSITVSWNASTDNVSVTGYEVFLNGTLAKQVAATTATFTGLNTNTTYAFTVLAKDLINNKSAQTTAVNGTTLTDSEAPTVPTNLAVSNATDSSFKLTWTASTDNTAVIGYDIFIDGAFKATSATESYTVTGLTTSTTYAATVLAKDAADNKSAQTTAINGVTTDGSSNGVTELFISEYVEGTGTNKVIEIANITSSTISLAGYDIRRNSNGGSSWSSPPLALDSGTIKDIIPGEVFVIGNGSNSNQTLLNEVDLVQPNNSSTNNGEPVNFNGNDPVGLFKNGVLIDIVGDFNGGSQNFAKDITLRRKSTVTAPNATYTLNEWDTFPVNTVDGIGIHTSTLSVENIALSTFKMYPNPTNGNRIYFQTKSDATISVYNILGKLILKTKISQTNNEIDISKLARGIYLVRVTIDNQFITKKLLKNN